MACGALVGVTCFGCIGPLAKKFDDRKLLIFVGLIPLIIGKIVLIPMGSDKPLYIDPTGMLSKYFVSKEHFIQFKLPLHMLILYDLIIEYVLRANPCSSGTTTTNPLWNL